MTTFLLCTLSFVAGGTVVVAHGKYRAWQQEGRRMFTCFGNALKRGGKS